MTWGYRLGVQMCGKLVPFWGSHNTFPTSIVLQMATYWFVIGWIDIQKAQKSKV